MNASTIDIRLLTTHAEDSTEAAIAPRLEDVLAVVERLAPADRARLREELRVRYDVFAESDNFLSPPHRLRR